MHNLHTHTHKYIGTTVLWCDTITTASHVSVLYNCTAQEYTALAHTVIYTGQQDYWALNAAVTSLGYSMIPSVDLLQLFEEDQTAEDLRIETSCNLIKWLLCSKLNNLVLTVHLPLTAMNPYSISCTYTLVSKHTQVVAIGSVTYASGCHWLCTCSYSEMYFHCSGFCWMMHITWHTVRVSPRRLQYYKSQCINDLTQLISYEH